MKPLSTTGHRESANWAIVAFSVLVVFGIICYPVLYNRVYASFDTKEFFIPSRAFYQLALGRGEMGFWSPFMLRGFDNLGEGQTGLFYPGHYLLYRFLPLSVGFAAEQVLFFPLTVLFAFILLRRVYAFSPLGAVVGAGVFSFSSFHLAHFGHIHNCWQVAHYPLLVYSLERMLAGRKLPLHVALFTINLACIVFLGHPQYIALAVAVCGVVAAYRILVPKFSLKVTRRLVYPALSGVLGLALGAVQLVPTVHALRQSDRGQLDKRERQNFSIHPVNLLSNASPYVFKEHVAGDLVLSNIGTMVPSRNPSEFSIYFGPAAITLLLLGAAVFWEDIRRPENRRRVIVLGGIVIVMLLLTLGKYGGINSLLGYIPLVSQIRAPGRYSLILFGLLALTLARMADSIQDVELRPKRFLVVLPLLAVTTLFCIWASAAKGFSFAGGRVDFVPATRLFVGPAMILATVAAMWATTRWKPAIGILFGLCIVDTALYGVPIVKGVERFSFAKIEDLKQSMAKQGRMYRHFAMNVDPLYDGHYLVNGYMAIMPKTILNHADPQHLRLTSAQVGHVGKKQMPFPAPLPRFYLVPNLKVVPDPLDMKGVDLDTTALIGVGYSGELAGVPIVNGETVEIVDDGYDRLELRAVVRHRRVLVSTDRWSPDWVAHVNGTEQKVLPLFGKALRGIFLEPGTSRVVFSYRPRMFRIGAWISGFALVVTCALLVLAFVRRERAVETEPTVQ